MRPIPNIVDELTRIPTALVPGGSRRPRWRSDAVGAGWGLTLDLPDGWNYPPWVDKETWSGLDGAVRGEAPNQEVAVGTDALAWYTSFHHGVERDWGIFIPVSSLTYCERRILADVNGERAWKWQVAFDFLLAHEQMHFAVDYICAQWELLLAAPCWAGLHDRMRAERLPFFAEEEQLANAHMLRTARAQLPRSVQRAFEAFVAAQPAGYMDALEVRDAGAFDMVLADVVRAYAALHGIERQLNLCSPEFEHGHFVPAQADLSCCPVHIIHDERQVGLPESAVRFITRIPRIVETEQFLRRLRKLEQPLQRRWSGLKEQMAAGIPRSARLEKMKGAGVELFSVRLNDNFRVHLQMLQPETWQAVAVGSHKDMGHG